MKKVLIVDDEQTNIELLKHGLKVRGFDVVVATDGVEGVVLARDHSPTLIICDIMMPNLDGYAFVKECRAVAELRHTPIVILSSNQDLKNKMEDEGDIAGYFIKPVNLNDILATVESLIGAAEI